MKKIFLFFLIVFFIFAAMQTFAAVPDLNLQANLIYTKIHSVMNSMGINLNWLTTLMASLLLQIKNLLGGAGNILLQKIHGLLSV